MKSKRENSKSLMLKKEDKNMTKIIKKKKNNLKVPNLRFPGFDGEWETKTLGEICKMKAGKFISASEIIDKENNILFPCYGGNGLRGYVNSFNKVGTYSLIGRQGALCGNVNLASGKFYATEHAVVVTPHESINTIWMFYLLNYLNLNQYATGMAQPGLSIQNLDKIESKIPKNIIEQQKLGSFLSLIDERIITQNKIIEELSVLKTNIAKKIFSQELRFKDNGNVFSPWKKHKLKNISNRIVEKNSENNQNVLTISAQHGLISQLEFFNKSVAAKNTLSYYLLKKNDFAYNKSYSNGYPMGAIKRLNKYEKGVVSTLYICFEFNHSVNKDFMEHYFESGIQNSEIEKVAQEGARNHGLLNIGVSDFFNITINLPSIDEQKAIASFLSSLVSKIENEKQILCQLNLQKQFLLKELFI